MTQPFTRNYEKPSVGVYIWRLTNADGTGAHLSRNEQAADRTVQVFGTFDSGTVTIQGSNEDPPVNWSTLHDAGGADLTMTANEMQVVIENPLFIRPILTGAGATGDTTVILVCKGD